MFVKGGCCGQAAPAAPETAFHRDNRRARPRAALMLIELEATSEHGLSLRDAAL